jgi:hypothetical protein
MLSYFFNNLLLTWSLKLRWTAGHKIFFSEDSAFRKNELQTARHNHISITLLLATYFGFCGETSLGN